MQLIKSYTDIQVNDIPRPWYKKILGFRSGKKWKMVIASIVYLLILSSFISNFGNSGKQGTNSQSTTAATPASTQQTIDSTQQKVNTEEKKKEDAAKKKEQQKAIIQFEQELYSIEKPATAAGNRYKATAEKMGKGQATIYDLYEAASNANKQADKTRYAYSTLKVPEGLPADVTDMLKEAKSKLSTAYYTKSKAMEYAMEFIDSQKPSDLQKAKEETQMSDQFILAGITKVLEAKEKMGIPLDNKKQ
ncbi:Uncharacterized protein BN1090_A2_02698 [Aneurinibacillus migulanus]|nr:Uncharacterized protein BN1090_A2_02698 [Aneurinibacillus migulanus]